MRFATLLIVWLLGGGGLAAISLVSVEEEVAIGKQAAAQVGQKMPALRDAQVAGYLRRLGLRLAGHAPGPKYPYTFAVVDDGEINAFALPGGPVFVHRGVFRAATNESQLAGVVAHEIAHIAQRHAASQLTKTMLTNWGIGLLGAVLGNTGGAGPTQVAAGLLANGAFLKFSRDDEAEADRVGLDILMRAGWDARGMVELFEILRREARRDPGAVEVFLSTHPSPQDRISWLQADVARSHGGRRDSREFQAVKARVGRLPAPRPVHR
jgi:predicted Zn-dependent protease